MEHFFVGMHNLQRLEALPECCISYLRLRNRRKKLLLNDWILDSGAFSQISNGDEFSVSINEYIAAAEKWGACGNLMAVVTQDYMCEPQILARCHATVREQQEKTLERYVSLRDRIRNVYLMPVLQGWHPEEYIRHLEQYDFEKNKWIGVGSVCRRQNTKEISQIIYAIRRSRPDLRLHLFGAKTTALSNPLLHSWIYSADSAAWSYAARRQGRDRNSVNEAYTFWKKIKSFDSGIFR